MIESFKHNWAGYQELMKSDGVRADLQRRADRVKQQVEGHLDRLDVEITIWADTTTGRTRAGATVAGVPEAVEVDHRVLGGALDAADG